MCKLNIKIADSLKYDYPYKTFYKKSVDLLNILKMSEEFLDEFLDLPEIINVKIRPLKGPINARYSFDNNLLEIDPRKNSNIGVLLTSACHEFVHAEQFKQKRLQFLWDYNKSQWIHCWNGSKVNSKGTTYKKYRELPWEVEAFDRQEEISTKITNKIVEKVNKEKEIIF